MPRFETELSIVFTRGADQEHDHARKTALAKAIDQARSLLLEHTEEVGLQKNVRSPNKYFRLIVDVRVDRSSSAVDVRLMLRTMRGVV